MKDNKVFIQHILSEINFIIKKCANLKLTDFKKDEVLTRAIARSLEIIGEATKNLSADFRNQNKDIDWKILAGLRDKLIHHYFGINWTRVWDIIQNIIPDLKEKIEKLLTVSEYEKVHKYSNNHREELSHDKKSGCFYCLKIFSPKKIKRWIDNNQTALCPYCDIDSIIGESSGFPITKSFLKQMHKYWFQTVKRVK